MTTYTLTLSLDQDTRTFLKNGTYSLFVFKGIDAGSGAASTVWFKLTGDKDLYNQPVIPIKWEEEFYIGENKDPTIIDGASAGGFSPYVKPNDIRPVKLGQTYIYEGISWDVDSIKAPSETAFWIQNKPSSENAFYISQKIDSGANDYIVVQTAAGNGGTVSFTPIATISMIFASSKIQKGTIITQAFSSGTIITFVGDTETKVTYSSSNGWDVPSSQQGGNLSIGDSIYSKMVTSYLGAIKSRYIDSKRLTVPQPNLPPGGLLTIEGHQLLTPHCDTRMLPASASNFKIVIIPNLSVQRQEQSNWCWLACSASVHNYYDPQHPVSQCGLASNATGLQCCTSPVLPGCNIPGFPSGCLTYLGNRATSFPINQLSFPQVQTEVNNNRPIVLGYTQEGKAVGHTVVICGYDDNETANVYVIDPLSGIGLVPFSNLLFTYSQFPSEVCFTKACVLQDYF